MMDRLLDDGSPDTVTYEFIDFATQAIVLPQDYINFNKIMQLSDPQQLLDCFSANELLHALNILQSMKENNEELELSFNQSSPSLFNTNKLNHQSSINFQRYIAMKNRKAGNPRSPSKESVTKSSKSRDISRKVPASKTKHTQADITPRSRENQATPKKHKTAQFHSRTPSPLFGSKQPKAIATNHRKTTSICTTSGNTHICNKSKQILTEKEKRGHTYIPIHLRQQLVVKERQEKLAKLQRTSLKEKEIQNRECTFKPQIKQYRKSKGVVHNRHCNHTVNDSSILESSISPNQENCPKDNNQSTKTSEPGGAAAEKCHKRKYRNSKFNILLDLIK